MKKDDPMRAVVEALKRHESFVVVGHIRPDADAVGAVLAMQRILRSLGKRAEVALRDPVPRQLRFLPGAAALTPVHRLPRRNEAVILLDTPTPERSGYDLPEGRHGTVLINVDHHVSNLYYGDVNWVVPEGPATCTMLFRLAQALDVPVDRDLATLLFAGIMTDTGYFRFDCVTHEVFEAAAALTRLGADPSDLHRRVYEQKPLHEIRRLGALLTDIRTTRDGRIGWIQLPDADDVAGHEARHRPDMSTLFANLCSAKDLDIGFCLDQKSSTMTVIELRSRGEVNVSEIAAKFGGGGHRNAAGCVFRGSADAARRRLLPILRDALP